jgi:signal transduction histidine kinase
MGGYPLLDAGKTPEGTLSLLFDLLDQLPVSVAVYGVEAGFPPLYCNLRMAEQQDAIGPDVDLALLQHGRIRDLAEGLLERREPERVRLNVPAGDGRNLVWDWTLSPLLDPGGKVVALVAVVEDLSQPVLARRRMESAVDQGMHLLLEVARLAEERSRIDDFLAAVSERVATLVQADGVAFNVYDPARKALVGTPGPRGLGPERPTSPATLPCDPAASDLLSQVVFAGRVYRGTLDFTSLEFRPYAHLARFWRDTGTGVLVVPWRAGNERLGALIAHGTRKPEGFTEENAIVLIAAGHAAGLVWQRKRAEQKLAERAEELESLERAKSSFLLLASHELRTPLTVLNGYVSMLADASQSPEHVVEIVPILQQAVDRMNVLVDQLMDATRVADSKLQLERRAVDLRTTVESVVNRIVPRWHREVDFELKLPDAAVPVLADELRIETAVENLVDNAFKYSVPGDRVHCDLSVENGVARLVVRDDGIGMSQDEVAGLFRRFGRMVNAQNSHIGGTGLGLYLSREIARLHGGEIEAASAVGRGSQFDLTLPLREARIGAGSLEESK